MKFYFVMVFFFTSLIVSAQSQMQFQLKPIPSPVVRLKQIDSFNTQQPLYSKLSANSQEIYYYTNLARLRPVYFWDSVVVPILNVYPQLQGSNAKSLKKDLYNATNLPMFLLQRNLINAAMHHANDLSKHPQHFSHDSYDGTMFIERLEKFGLKDLYLAENISQGQQSIVLSIVLLYLDIGVASLGHRENLLNPTYSHIGIAYSLNNNNFYFVQDFSSTPSN